MIKKQIKMFLMIFCLLFVSTTAVNTESAALDGVTFEYKLSTESDWKPLYNPTKQTSNFGSY